MIDSEMDLPELVQTEEGSSLFYRSKWLYSRQKPVSRAIALAQSIPLLEECIYLVYSPCLWYGVCELLTRLPPSSAILAIECDPALYRLASENMPARIRDALQARRLAFIAQVPESHFFNTISILGRFRKVQEVLLSSGWTIFPEYYKALPQTILKYFSDYYRSRITLTRLGRLWIRNTLKNLLALPAIPAPLPHTAKPVLVCGAGVSLYNALQWISVNRDRFFILACDTAFGTLRDAGIVPDSIVCLDAQFYNVIDLIGSKEQGTVPHGFLDMSAHPSLFKNIFQSITPLMTMWAQTELLATIKAQPYDFLIVDPYGSVGLTALSLAHLIAEKEIWITGLDFAFPPGWTHAPATHIDRYEMMHENRLYKRKLSWNMTYREGSNKFNSFLRSDPALNMYHALCNTLIEQFRDDCIIVDMRRNTGLPLGKAVRVCSEPDFLRFDGSMNTWSLKQQNQNENLEGSPASRGIHSMQSEKKNSLFYPLIANEYKKINELREMLKYGADPELLRSKLARLDYLFIHFPDYERVQSLELDLLKRIACECEYWMYFIKKICPECANH